MAVLEEQVSGLTGNLLLDSLPPASMARLMPKLVKFEAEQGMPIAHTGAPIEYAYFPIRSVISAVTAMRDGSGIEVTVIGREGFFGVQLALGSNVSALDAMTQIPNSLWRIGSADFRAALESNPELMQRSLSYALATIEMVSQFSACNRLHPVNERCARWLLMAHDRVEGDEFKLTHEYLATMLGVRRPSVSLAAAALDAADLISYSRGTISIRNRRGLEAAACECYDVANDALHRLLGYDVRKRP